ncbi:MAG: glycosyltransferase [Candidatus Hydrogenedens sp.]|nr:glycosyltransferase [Candidatus Hydrogenedens sp.]
MRLLMLNSTCCWRKPTAPFLQLGEALAARGVEVRHIVGGGGVCSFYGTLQDWNDSKCFGTQDRVTREIEAIGNPVRNLRDFETPEMHARVDSWWESQQSLPPGERVYRGFHIRDLIRGSLARHLFRPLHPDPAMPGQEEDGTEAEREMAHRMSRAAALAIEIAEAALLQIQPDCLMTFNGYFYLEWVFAAMAKRLGIRTVAHEAACFADRMFFDEAGVIGNRHGLSSGAIRHYLDVQDLTPSEQQELDAYLSDIYAGKVNTIAQAGTENLEELRARLQLPQDKRIVLLIGQVAYDTVVIYDSGVFRTSLEYLKAGIEAAQQVPDCHLVIRLHPHEMIVNNNWTWRQISEWDLPPNVTVVHSRDANTYQLMQLADCGLAMTSQAGLEMAAFGKPVVVCGRAFYRDNGFTYDVSSPEGVVPALERALADGPLAGDRKRRIDCFLHYHIFRYLVPFDTDNDRFSDEAVTRILRVCDPIGSKRQSVEPASAPPENIVPNPTFAEDTAGWKANGSSIERVELDGAHALRVATGSGAWDGVLYGCSKGNTCDDATLAADPGIRHEITVRIKADAGSAGAPVQLHVVGNGGHNYGATRAALSEDWQEVSLQIRTQAEATHLGIQIVKANHPQPVSFLVGSLNVLPEKRRSGAPAIVRRRADAFPRLLLIDEVPFGNATGYAVTITNLFRGWPRERLAEIYRTPDYDPDYEICRQHLPLWDPHLTGAKRTWRRPVRPFENPYRLWRGEFDVYSHYVNTNRALAWAKPFKPDLIFTSPVTYGTARFALRMSRRLGVPYVCHIMDDWLASWENGARPVDPKPGEKFFQQQRNKLTKKLFAGAASCQVISEPMAKAYGQRYGHDFKVFHNAIDLGHWDRGPRDYSATGTPFTIRYTGAIWNNIQMPTLAHAAEAVAELAAEGHAVRLEIYCHENFANQYGGQLRKDKHVVFCDLVPYAKMPDLMREADALLVPVTFDEKMLLFSRHSMPTKVPECMISGTPVLLYGPADAAPVAYAKQEGWGAVVDTPDKEAFKQKVLELMRDPAARERAGAPAQQLARDRHALTQVREAFWEDLLRAAHRG